MRPTAASLLCREPIRPADRAGSTRRNRSFTDRVDPPSNHIARGWRGEHSVDCSQTAAARSTASHDRKVKAMTQLKRRFFLPHASHELEGRRAPWWGGLHRVRLAHRAVRTNRRAPTPDVSSRRLSRPLRDETGSASSRRCALRQVEGRLRDYRGAGVVGISPDGAGGGRSSSVAGGENEWTRSRPPSLAA
jgi:hypothetical protein